MGRLRGRMLPSPAMVPSDDAPAPEQTAALIAGGAGGVGLAAARRLEALGYRIVLLVRDVHKGREAARQLEREPAIHACDVTDRAAVEEAVREAAASVGPPLVLVNAAGIAESRPLLPPDDDLWARTLAVNATGPWIATTACLPYMQEAGHGFVCTVASTAALQGYRYTAAYVASKHAVLGLTRALAADLGSSGIRVTAVCPGFLDTPMTARTVANMTAKTGMGEDDARAALASMNPSGRLITPEEVADRIVALLQGAVDEDEPNRMD